MSASSVYKEEQHYQNTCDSVGELWRQRFLCDVNIMVEDAEGRPKVSVPAHKIILAASIPYFRAMFSSDMQESSQREVRLKEVDEVGLKAIIRFVYSGKLEMTETNIHGVLTTASFLGLGEMVQGCVRFIIKHLSPSNCLEVRRLGFLFNLDDLKSAADNYVQKNFAKVTKEEDFLTLSVEEVDYFVSNDHISVESEEDIYRAITRWVENGVEKEKKDIVKLYNLVRFPILDPGFIKSIVLNNKILTSTTEAMMMVREAINYHENPASIILFSNPKKTQPRSSMMGVICIVGGSGDAGETLVDMTFFNPHEKQWKPGTKMLQHRTRLGLALFKGELYAIGGSDVTESLSSVEKYSPVTDKWEMVASMKMARRSCSTVVTRYGIYVLGGFNGDVFLHSMELYKPDLDEWSYQTPMIEARSDFCSIFFDQRIYAIGGYCSTGQLRSVERFDLINRRWEIVADMYTPRANAGTVIMNVVLSRWSIASEQWKLLMLF